MTTLAEHDNPAVGRGAGLAPVALELPRPIYVALVGAALTAVLTPLGQRTVDWGLRFAFYGCVSTQDYQDPVSSQRWQFDFAAVLVAGHGRIVATYFDVGYSREIAWADWPEDA